MMKKIILLVSYIVLSLQVNADGFDPKTKEFKGYIYEVSGDSLFFCCFSPVKKISFDFAYDAATQSFTWNDTSIVMIFYGSQYPKGLEKLYHNRTFFDWFDSCPTFSKRHVYISSFTNKKYHVSRARAHFTAYNYQDYKAVEKKYGKLNSFGIYTHYWIYPDMIKSKNETYLINYFYSKK